MTPSPSSQQILQPSISPSQIQLPFQQHHQPQQIVTPTVQQQLHHHHQQQDGLLVVTTNNTTTFVTGTAAGTTTTHDQVQEQRVKTPNRRSSLTQSIQSSPNAGGTAVTYRPSPTQSPAHLSTSTTVSSTTTYNSNSFGTVPAGHEFNTTLIGSNNISLNKVKIEII